MDTGLNTGLKLTFGIKNANHESENLEGFLSSVEKPSSGRISDADASDARTRKPEKYMKSFRN